MTIGEKVKAAREEKRLSQKALADKIGLSEYTVIRLEKGRREPRPSELEKIAEVLGVPVASLYDAVPMKTDVVLLPAPTGRQIPVPLLSPEVTACCGSGIPMYDEIQNSPEKVMMFSISDLGGVYDEMRPPFAVKAEGCCLEKSRIFDGDILIFNPAAEPRQGQICIVCWGGALSAKKVVRHGDGSITLYSDADEFHLSPQEAGDPDRFSIWGPVVKSVVNFR